MWRNDRKDRSAVRGQRSGDDGTFVFPGDDEVILRFLCFYPQSLL